MTEKKTREQRVGEIVDAAVEEFLEKGYEGASMEGIAKRAGLSKGGLYHHFSGKDEVLIYSVRKLSEPIYPIFNRAARAASAAEGLNGFIADYLNYWQHHIDVLKFYFQAMVKAFQDTGISEIFDYSKEVYPLVSGVFARGIEQHELKAHDAQSRGLAMMSALDGVLAYLLLDKNLSFDDIIARYKKVFIDEIKI